MQVETYKAWLAIAIDLWKNDRVFYSANKKLVDWRLSHYYYALGTAYFMRKKYGPALENFVDSLKLNVRQKTAYLYLVSSAFKALFEKTYSKGLANG
jgi:hypothetical protein